MILILLLLVLGVKAKINPFGPTVVNDYVNCVNEIIEFNFARPGLLYIVNTNNASRSVVAIRTAVLKSVHDNLKLSVKVSSPTKKDSIPACSENQKVGAILGLRMDSYEPVPLADYAIGIVDNFKDFTFILTRLTRARSWNPHALFIFVLFGITSSNDQNIENAENMIYCLYKLNAIKVVVILPQENNVRNANIYGWRPYDPPKYCGYYNETYKNRLRLENVCENGNLKYTKGVFKNRVPSNMEGCVLKILALERQPFVSSKLDDPNMEKLLINEVAEQYNLTLRFEILNLFRGEKQDEGPQDEWMWDGALEVLEARKDHVLLGGIFPDDEVHQDFECSTSYLTDSYTWVVPRALHEPLWVALFIIFRKSVWLSVVATFCLIAVVWKILATLSKDSTYRNNFDHYLINTWISNLGFVAFSRPVTNSLRLFYVFLNLYCVLLLTAYTTKLIDVLTNPTFEHQMSTVEELVESDMKFGGSEELHDIFENSTDPLDMYVQKHWVDVINISRGMIDVAFHRNFSILCSRLELAHISAMVPELSDSYGNPKFYAFERNVFTVPMEMVALRGFPFMRKFSRTLDALKQSGVVNQVRKYFAGYTQRRKARMLRDIEREYSNTGSLSIQTLQSGYLALIFGYVLGSIILVVEIIINTDTFKNIAIFRNCNLK